MADPRTRLDDATYLTHLTDDAGRLLAAATGRLAEPAPSCPGWTVADVVEHTAQVYLDKAARMRDARPPEAPVQRGAVPLADFFRSALAEVTHELTHRDRDAYAAGWWPFDPSVAFWFRRMAHETLVHRVDVEQGAGAVSAIDPALARDGLDEVLVVMLAGEWSDAPEPEAAGRTVTIRSGSDAWRVVLEPAAVAATPGLDLPSDATVAGTPADLLLWAWGRAGADRLDVGGDPAVAVALRRRLALATQ